MNWWGKLIGTGVGMLGGPLGAIAGAALGHIYDDNDPTPKNEQKARILYLAYFFSCAAKVAKADGYISAEEIATTESLMLRFGLDDKTKEFAKNIFRKSKANLYSIDEDFNQVGRMIQYDPTVGQTFLGGLFEIARSNGKKINELQVRYLLRCEEQLKIQPGTLQTWIRGGYAPPQYDSSSNTLSLEESYQTLDLKISCSDSEIKIAYRRKAAVFHPDKLNSKNLPDEFTSFANDQLAKINQANEIIMKARGIK